MSTTTLLGFPGLVSRATIGGARPPASMNCRANPWDASIWEEGLQRVGMHVGLAGSSRVWKIVRSSDWLNCKMLKIVKLLVEGYTERCSGHYVTKSN
jgi:hypothetical protein